MLLTVLAVLSIAPAASPRIFPPPREATWAEGAFQCPAEVQVFVPPGWAEPAARYLWLFASSADKTRLRVAVATQPSDGPVSVRQVGDANLPREGYEISIDAGGVRIQAGDSGGLFNAFATLSQIIEQVREAPLGLPACRIRDWPEVRVRAAHIDLTCQQYTVAYVRSLMRTLACYKVNAILMEYSDMFPFRRHGAICRPDAFSEDDVKSILQTAAECNQEVIPFLQSLGHLDYVLHVPEYARLGANHKGYMYCPSSPETIPFARELIDEIMEQHPGVRRIHIGGDEVPIGPGGACSSCDAYVKEHGFSALYVNHYRQVAEYCRVKGVKPLMWSDMILQHPEAISQLPRDIAWVVWDYGVTTDPTPQMFHGATLDRLDQLSPVYRRYFGKGIGLEDAKSRGGFVAFGHALGFKDLGFEAFTAPAARCGGDNFDWPRFDLHMPNIRLAFSKAADFGLPGAIVTSWSYRSSPHELCLPELACTSSGWNNDRMDVAAVLATFQHQRYGIDYPPLAESVLKLSTVLPATTLAYPKRDNERNAWVFGSALQLAQLKDLVKSAQREQKLEQHRVWLAQVQATARLGRQLAQTAVRHQEELRYWDLALFHIEHRLSLIQPLARLAAVAYADAPATAEQIRQWEQELRAFDRPRLELREGWEYLYGGIATPRHLEIQLLERFDAEAEMVEVVLRDAAAKTSAPASRP
jgi:hypothetical protein